MGLCFDEHHKTHLGQFLVQRAVEAMLGGTTVVFKNEFLVARAKALRLTKEDTKEDKKEEKKEDFLEEKILKEEKNEEKKGGKAKNKRKEWESVSDEASESTDDIEWETPKKKKNRK